jgi:putative endonuclease
MFEHKGQFQKSFSQRYNTSMLVYYEEYPTPMEAIRREKHLKKKFTRKKKEHLISSMNPEWKDLSEGWFDDEEFETHRKRMKKR